MDYDSILISIKKLLGIDALCDHFDQDIIIHINTAFSTLTQLGVGPSDGFFITSDVEKWSDFLPEKPKMEFVKTYVYLKVRLIFDPPSSSSVMEAMDRQIKELEWRINISVDPPAAITSI